VDALRRWRELLQGRAIPPEILDAAPEPPWGFSPAVFRARTDQALSADPSPTTRRAREALPDAGSVLDVGCGGGATSLPLVDGADRLILVDTSDELLAFAAETAGETGVAVETVAGAWPDVAPDVPTCDVAVCGHVLYNVADLDPFVRALHERARRRVVCELTAAHPLVWMNDLWRRFHHVSFPDGPTSDDAVNALRELGIDTNVEVHRAGPERAHGWADDPADAVALVRRRLCLTADDDPRVAEALGPRLRQDGEGRWSAGPQDHTVVTLWWDTDG
jgi:SAM-dependent methyltransferase